MSKILWVDNDPAYIDPYVSALVDRGDEIKIVTTARAADSVLDKETYDLVILDVMIPTRSAEEEEIYNPEETDNGLKTGLVFYRRNRQRLMLTDTPILVLTVRLDRLILDEFLKEGLPAECFRTKMSLREVDKFIDRVASLIEKAKHD